jgi:hypothetical protein
MSVHSLLFWTPNPQRPGILDFLVAMFRLTILSIVILMILSAYLSSDHLVYSVFIVIVMMEEFFRFQWGVISAKKFASLIRYALFITIFKFIILTPTIYRELVLGASDTLMDQIITAPVHFVFSAIAYVFVEDDQKNRIVLGYSIVSIIHISYNFWVME